MVQLCPLMVILFFNTALKFGGHSKIYYSAYGSPSSRTLLLASTSFQVIMLHLCLLHPCPLHSQQACCKPNGIFCFRIQFGFQKAYSLCQTLLTAKSVHFLIVFKYTILCVPSEKIICILIALLNHKIFVLRPHFILVSENNCKQINAAFLWFLRV